MAGETTSIEAERIGTMRVQTSAYGLVIPLAYGRTRITGNLMWYGDFAAIPHVEESGGKGGGGVEQTTYSYRAAVAMGMCEGQIGGVRAVWKGKERVGDAIVVREVYPTVPATSPFTITIPGLIPGLVQAFWWRELLGPVPFWSPLQLVGANPGKWQFAVSGETIIFGSNLAGLPVKIVYSERVGGPLTALNLTVFNGSENQVEWSHLATNHPEQALAYPGIAYVASPAYTLSSVAALDNHSFEVIGRLPYNTAAGIDDASPKDVLLDLLTSTEYGANFASLGDLMAFSDYCLAAGILISPYWADQRPAHEYVTELAQLGNAAPLWSEGTLKLIPYADAPVAGALGSFTPSVTPIYDLTDDDFLPRGEGDPIEVRRRTQADSFNQVSVEFANRGKDYNPDVADAKDMADIELHGLRAMSPVKLPAIANPAVAETVANVLLNRSLYIRNQYEFSLGWRFALLEPMDVVTLTDAQLGLDKTPVRIIEIGESEEGELSVVAEEFLAGVSAPALFSPNIPAGYNVNYSAAPGHVEAPVFVEPPIEKTATGLEVWAAVSGSGELWGGCDVYVSLDGDTYKFVGRVDGGSRYGSLKASMAAGGAATASITLAGRATQMLPGTAAEAAALATLCWIGTEAGGEFFAYQGAALVAANEYDLTGLVRGAYGTSDAAHAAGQKFVRVDERIAKSEPLDLSMIGKTVWFKFASFNSWGGGTESLADVVAYPYTITGAMAKLPPSDVTSFSASATADRVLLSWQAVPDVDLAEYEVREGTVWSGAPTVARARSTQVKIAPRVAGTYSWMVKAIDVFGNYSGAPTSASLTVASPPAVAVTAALSGTDYVLSWDAPVGAYAIGHYEVRHGATWEAGTFITRANAQTLKGAVDWVGARTFWVAAVDAAGNVGTPGSASLTVSEPVAPTVAAAISGAQTILSWNEPNASLPVAEYEVRRGADWATGAYLTRLTARSLAITVDWGGDQAFMVAAVDANGTVGAAGSVSVSISLPSAPTVTAEVIDNNVLLRWSQSSGTLPIKHYEVRRGATWATSGLVGTLNGGFTTYFESSAGTYSYWVAGVDVAGNVGTPASATAIVSQPPDFKLLYDYDQPIPGGTLSSAQYDAQAGGIVLPVNTTETFEQHFTGGAWASPQDQVSAGYEYFAEPAAAAGYVEWLIDYGTQVASTMITVTPTSVVIDGAPTVTPKISVSADNVNWTDFNGVWQAFASAFRYVKVRITAASAAGGDLLLLSRVNVKLAFKLKNEAGSGTASASDTGGTQVSFTEAFVDVEAITVTAGGTSPLFALYDFVDVPYPTGFKVLLFDTNGNRASGSFSWAAKGV